MRERKTSSGHTRESGRAGGVWLCEQGWVDEEGGVTRVAAILRKELVDLFCSFHGASRCEREDIRMVIIPKI